jgi:hypothetical protein
MIGVVWPAHLSSPPSRAIMRRRDPLMELPEVPLVMLRKEDWDLPEAELWILGRRLKLPGPRWPPTRSPAHAHTTSVHPPVNITLVRCVCDDSSYCRYVLLLGFLLWAIHRTSANERVS